jgi:hypothetical protein
MGVKKISEQLFLVTHLMGYYLTSKKNAHKKPPH